MRIGVMVLTGFAALASQGAMAAIEVSDAQDILSAFEQEFVAPIQQKFGAQFEFYYNPALPWVTPVVALAADRTGMDWSVGIFSGAIFHPKMTRDAFVVVLCHELGHHFGGAPWEKEDTGALRWASTEGQADFYATAVCAKRMLSLIPFRDSEVPAPFDLRQTCASRIQDKTSSVLCARSLFAAQNLAEALVDHDLSWSASDPKIVTQTLGVIPDPKDGHYQYPSDECRMQTLRTGALCQQISRPTTEDLLGISGRERFCANDRPRCWWSPVLPQ